MIKGWGIKRISNNLQVQIIRRYGVYSVILQLNGLMAHVSCIEMGKRKDDRLHAKGTKDKFSNLDRLVMEASEGHWSAQLPGWSISQSVPDSEMQTDLSLI